MSYAYEDILYLPHKQSDTRPHMPLSDRAAQFAPFAALTGYGDAIRETVRRTDTKPQLSHEAVERMNRKLAYLVHALQQAEACLPEVQLTYFVPDEKKTGGACVTLHGVVEEVDEVNRMLYLSSRRKVPMENLLELSGTCLEDVE